MSPSDINYLKSKVCVILPGCFAKQINVPENWTSKIKKRKHLFYVLETAKNTAWGKKKNEDEVFKKKLIKKTGKIHIEIKKKHVGTLIRETIYTNFVISSYTVIYTVFPPAKTELSH